jgi:hypothetical protein
MGRPEAAAFGSMVVAAKQGWEWARLSLRT